MKNKLLIIVFGLFISLNVNAEVNANISGKTLDQFFLMSSEIFKKTIIVEPSVNGSVKVFQVNHAANFRDVFFSVMRAHNLVYVESKTVIRIQPRGTRHANDEIITKVFKLKNLVASDLVEPLSKSLKVQASTWKVPDVTNVDSIIADTALMVTAPRSMINNIQSMLDVVDVKLKQIRVRAVIVETIDGNLADLTVDMQLGAGSVKLGMNGSGIGFSNTLPNLISTSSDFSAFIRYIESSDKTKILSKPELTIMHGQDGFISVGQELPFLTGQYTTDTDSSDRPFQTIERKDVGLSLKVKPHIGQNGDIQLTIGQELSRVDKSVEASDIVTSKRSISTVLNVKSGSSVALGGMTGKDSQVMKSKVPFLGDIPFVGLLFSSESKKVTSRTLNVVLFIEEL